MDTDALAGLHVADDAQVVGDQHQRIVELGREGMQLGRGVLRVAHIHAGIGMTDGDERETILQRGEVAHAEFQEAGRRLRRIVVAVDRLAGATDAVALGGGVRFQDELTATADLVVAGLEVDIVGDDADVATSGNRGDDPRVQNQGCFASSQIDVDHARGGVETAVGPDVANDVQAVRLAHHDIVIGRAGAALDHHGEILEDGPEGALDALGLDADHAGGGVEIGIADVDQAAGVEHEVSRAPGRAGCADQTRVGGGIGDFETIQGIVETHPDAAIIGGIAELVVVQIQGIGTADRAQHQTVIAAAGDQPHIAMWRDIEQVVTGPGVDDGVTPGQVEDDGVVAAAGCKLDFAGIDRDIVIALAGIDDGVGIGQGQAVIAVAGLDGGLGILQGDQVIPRAGVERDFAASDADGVVAAAGVEGGQAAQHVDEVVAAPAVDGIDAGTQIDDVVAITAVDLVGTRPHVDDVAAVIADEAVVALLAQETDATGAAAEEAVVAGATLDHAAGRATENGEVVIAIAALEIQFGGDALADINVIVAGTASRNDLAHTAMGGVHPQRGHGDAAVGILGDGRGFVGDLVVDVAATIAPGVVAHVQVERVADLMGDDRRRAPAPHVIAGHTDAHDRDLGLQVGGSGGDFHRTAEARQGDVDVEQAHVDFEIERAIDAGGKAGVAQGERHAGFQMQRSEVDVETDRTGDLEVAVGLDVAADVDLDEAEEIERGVIDAQFEDTVDQAHAAGEGHLEGEQVHLAFQSQVEQGATGDTGMGLAAGVDLKQTAGVDADDIDAQGDIDADAHGEHRGVAFHDEGGGQGHVETAEVTQFQHQVAGGFQPGLVDLDVQAAGHVDEGRHLDAGIAGDAQEMRVEDDVDEGVADAAGVEGAHRLVRAGGVDLQQEVAGHLEQGRGDQCGVGAAAGEFQAAIDAAGDDAERACGVERFQDGQVELRGNAHLEAGFGDDDAEVALQQQRIAEHRQVAVALQLHVHALPFRLAGGGGGNDVLVEVDQIAEGGRHDVDDLLLEGVHGQAEMRPQLGEITEVDAGIEIHAQGDAIPDHQQAGGMRLQHEVAIADLGFHIGEDLDALGFTGAQVQHALQHHHVEDVEFRLAVDTQQLLVEHQDDGLVGVAGGDGIARQGLVIAGDGQVVGFDPGAAGEVDGGETEFGDQAFDSERDGPGDIIHLEAGVDAGAHAGVQVQAQVFRAQDQAIGHADQADVVHIRLHRHVHADIQAFEVDHQFLGQQDAEVEITDGQTDGVRVHFIVFVDVTVAVAVPEISVRHAILERGDADESIGVVDTQRQGGDGGAITVGQVDLLAAFLGQRHGTGHLQEARQIDLGVAHFRLDDLRVEIQEYAIVAASGQHEAGGVDAAVAVLVLALLQQAVAVEVFAGIEDTVAVEILAQIEDTVAVHVLGVVRPGGAFLVVDRGRPEQLQAGVEDRGGGGFTDIPEHGVDVDFDILHLGGKDVLVDTDQAGQAHIGLGGDELGRVGRAVGDEVKQRRLHHGHAEVDVVDDQADGVLVDLVREAIGDGQSRDVVDGADQVIPIAVGAADTDEAGEVGAADGDGFHLQREGIEREVEIRVGHRTQRGSHLIDDGPETAHVEGGVVDVAHAERQGTLQMQELGDLDDRLAHIDVDQVIAFEIHVDRLAAGFDLETGRYGGQAAAGRLRRKGGAVIGGGAHHAAEQLAALLDLQGHVAGAHGQHVAKTIEPHLIQVAVDGIELLGLDLLAEQVQVGLHDGHAQIQVFQAETDDILIIEGPVEIDVTDADEAGDVGRPQGHALEADATQA